jgi:hypothetical protein
MRSTNHEGPTHMHSLFSSPELIFSSVHLNRNEVPDKCPSVMKDRHINRCKYVKKNLYPVLPCLHLAAICIVFACSKNFATKET